MRKVITFALVALLAVGAQDPGLDLPVTPPAPGASAAAAPTPAPEQDPADQEPDPVIFYGEEVEPGDSLVFVLDRSCSMATGRRERPGPDGIVSRFERAKRQVQSAVVELEPTTRIGCVVFDHRNDVWRENLVPATSANKASFLAWLETIYPRGGTDTGPGTVVGLAWRPDTLLLVTDGVPAGLPEDHRCMIRNGNLRPSVIHTFGVEATQAMYRSFLINVALDNGGRYVDVP